jgi:putative membrane protein
MLRRIGRGFAVLLIAGCASNEATTPEVDHTFVKDAASGGMMEVTIGRLAARMGESDAVKQFGKHMVDDHTKANEELRAAAKRDGIRVPNDMIPAHRTEVARFANLSGKEFDRAYARAAVTHHEETIAAFEQEAAQGKQTAVKQFAVRTLPKLREHLRMAQTLEGKVK